MRASSTHVPTAAQSPQRATRKTPRRIELAPLPCATTGSTEASDRRSDESAHTLLVPADARDESLRPRTRTLSSMRSPPTKTYPRLRTLAQLAETHVDAMHCGAFITRSVDRWRDFEQRSSADESNNSNSQRPHSRDNTLQLSDDAQRAYAVARASAALVIQSAWRRFAAVSVRKRLVAAMWRRQMHVAARIAARGAWFETQLAQLEASRSLLPVASTLPLLGASVHLPATLLTLWLAHVCARSGSTFVRRSLAILQTVDVPVQRTLRTIAQLWHSITTMTTLRIQCMARAWLARRRFRSLHTQYKQQRAAQRLQNVVRVRRAKQLVRQLRRDRAAICIQCSWRCATARQYVQRQRVRVAALRLWRTVSATALAKAADVLIQRAAATLQRVVRGLRARARVRLLESAQQQQRWRRNPQRGLALFATQQVHGAARCLELCRRDGFERGLVLTVVDATALCDGDTSRRAAVTAASGSYMSFCSPLQPLDWLDTVMNLGDRRNDTVQCLAFWFAYALSHFAVYDATGCCDSLRLARTGCERFLSVCALHVVVSGVAAVGAFTRLRFEIRRQLLFCLFWTSAAANGVDSVGDARRSALALACDLLDEFDADALLDVRAELLMTRSMLLLQLGDRSACCAELDALLQLLLSSNAPTSTRYSELQVRFVLALVMLDSSADGSVDLAAAAATATAHLERCYQIVERWPGVGYFHGALSSSEARERLAIQPVGSYILHSEPVATDVVATTAADADALLSTDVVVLRVKLSDAPLRISKLRVHVTADGQYFTPKRSTSRYTRLHDFVDQLPPTAGVQSALGVRCGPSAVAARLEFHCEAFAQAQTHERELRARLLRWTDWMRHVRLARSGMNNRTNESWAALCLVVARELESVGSYVFAATAAKAALANTRDRNVIARASFVAAKCALAMHERRDAVSLVRLALLASDSDDNASQHWRSNVRTMQRALLPSPLSLSSDSVHVRRESFAVQLARVQKLERMCLRAWRFDSLAPTLKGDPFAESLLLQRVYDELYSACRDAFFLRSLLKAHVRAWLTTTLTTSGPYRLLLFESTHLVHAVAAAAQLVERFSANPHNADGSAYGRRSSVGRPSLQTPFPVDDLLRVWHDMPFAVCFEIAEALYRATSSHCASVDTTHVIHVYEQLRLRVRASHATATTYAAFDELLVLRLAFLYVEHSSRNDDDDSNATATQDLHVAVVLLDELITTRSSVSTTEHQSPTAPHKSITWPCVLTLPSRLSVAELAFTRGLLLETLEDREQQPRVQRTSWRSYDVLHVDLMARVTADSASATDTSSTSSLHVRGVRVFVGATQNVVVLDVLHCRPAVTVNCGGESARTTSAPSWTTLSPSWHEHMELPLSSTTAQLVVTLVDRAQRPGSTTASLGSVNVSMSELLRARDAFARGRFFDLAPSSTPSRHSLQAPPPQLFLSFQVLVQPHTDTSDSQSKQSKYRMSGNWALADVRAHLHGDLETFVQTRWVWSALGRRWLDAHEYAIARWFLARAVAAAEHKSQSHARPTNDDLLDRVDDLCALSTCYRANTPRAHWSRSVASLVERADALLLLLLMKNNSDATDPRVAKLQQRVDALKWALERCGDSDGSAYAPLATALARHTPASSDWVKLPVTPTDNDDRRDDSAAATGSAACYVNLDTGEHVVTDGSNGAEPLEYEDKALLRRCAFEAAGERPHRIIVLSPEMRARVAVLALDLAQRRAASDANVWTAVLNVRQQQMQFIRSSRSTTTNTRRLTTHAPSSYVMAADAFTLYHVLVLQDAVRQYQRRRRSACRLRGVVQCVRWLTHELLSARRRLAIRAERDRKHALTCVHVIVDRAQQLRAGDMFTSDPFVVATVVDGTGDEVAKGRTSVRRNTRNPRWHEEFCFDVAWCDVARTTVSEGGDDSVEDDSVDGENACYRKAAGVLRFEVCDYDVVALRRTGRKASDSSNSSGDSDGAASDGAVSDSDAPVDDAIQNGSDALGCASIALASLEHGQAVSAELPLTGARATGVLSVTVHWTTHAAGGGDGAGTRRRSRDRRIARARKLPLAKQPLPPEAALALLHDVQPLVVSAFDALLALASTVLDPLQRLRTRLLAARSAGRTADEAKVVEQRMLALARTQLVVALGRLDASLRATADAAQRLTQLELLRTAATEFAESQVPGVCEPLEAALRDTLACLDSATERLETLLLEAAASNMTVRGSSDDDDVTRLDVCFAAVVQRHKLLAAWREALETLTTKFFTADRDVLWPPTPVQTQADELVCRLDVAWRSSGMSIPAGVPPGARPLSSSSSSLSTALALAASTSSAVPLAAQASAPKTPAKAAADRRLERIQRAKQRKK